MKTEWNILVPFDDYDCDVVVTDSYARAKEVILQQAEAMWDRAETGKRYVLSVELVEASDGE